MKRSAIVQEAEDGGFWAEVPARPGCVTQGESMEEIVWNLHEAIFTWLLAAEPEPSGSDGRRITVAV